MKALVTGVTGFIGGALAAALTQAGWDVNVLVRPSSLPRVHPDVGYHVYAADLGDAPGGEHDKILAEAVDGCDVVYHAAAIRDRWGTPLDDYRRTNVEGTRRLLAAAHGRARRFVYVSSVGVFGHPGVLGIDEGFPVQAADGKVGYHSTKAEAERLVLEAHLLDPVVVRPTITYGPGDRDGMLTRLIQMLAHGRYIQIGTGRNHFHLTYIDDLTAGLLLAGTHLQAAGGTFILAGPRSIAVRELIEMVAQMLGCRVPAWHLPEGLARPAARGVEWGYKQAARWGLLPPGMQPVVTPDKIDTICVHRGFSALKAQRELGYQPQVDYPEGLERTLDWMRVTGLLAVNAKLGDFSNERRGAVP